MSQPQYSSDHDMLMERFYPQSWSFTKWLWQVLFEGSYFLLMVFFRFRIGRSFLTFANWFRGSLLIGIFWLLAVFAADPSIQHATDAPQTSSMYLLWLHSFWFNLFFIWRYIASIYYLRKSYKPNAMIVPENNIGDSMLYRVFHFLLSWTGMFDDEIRPRTFWKLNENRFMQVVEPVLIFLAGLNVSQAGYHAYGMLLMVGACAMARFMFTALNNNAKITQSQREAGYYSGQQNDSPERNRRVIGD